MKKLKKIKIGRRKLRSADTKPGLVWVCRVLEGGCGVLCYSKSPWGFYVGDLGHPQRAPSCTGTEGGGRVCGKARVSGNGSGPRAALSHDKASQQNARPLGWRFAPWPVPTGQDRNAAGSPGAFSPHGGHAVSTEVQPDSPYLGSPSAAGRGPRTPSSPLRPR